MSMCSLPALLGASMSSCLYPENLFLSLSCNYRCHQDSILQMTSLLLMTSVSPCWWFLKLYLSTSFPQVSHFKCLLKFSLNISYSNYKPYWWKLGPNTFPSKSAPPVLFTMSVVSNTSHQITKIGHQGVILTLGLPLIHLTTIYNQTHISLSVPSSPHLPLWHLSLFPYHISQAL